MRAGLPMYSMIYKDERPFGVIGPVNEFLDLATMSIKAVPLEIMSSKPFPCFRREKFYDRDSFEGYMQTNVWAIPDEMFK